MQASAAFLETTGRVADDDTALLPYPSANPPGYELSR